MEGGCNPADKTVMVYRSTSSKCQDDSSKFVFDPVRGITPFIAGHNFSAGIRFSKKYLSLLKISSKEHRTERSELPGNTMF